jgi:hypothetical protein
MLLACVTAACTATVYRAKFNAAVPAPTVGTTLQPVASRIAAPALDAGAPYLKCHFLDGSLVVLEQWNVDQRSSSVRGIGIRYNPDRVAIGHGRFELATRDVILFETNRPELVKRSGLVVMAVVSGASLALTAACVANPKACFGSCPTVYGYDGTRFSLEAESFSTSIARSLESTDVDALFNTRMHEGRLRLWATNEAPETHAIRSVSVLAVERPAGGRVYRAGEAFYACGPTLAPSACSGSAGDCKEAVQRPDDIAYSAPTNGEDLAAKETIELAFENVPQGELGLVVGARNGLLNSFLLYQALAYMGTRAGNYMAELERAQGHVISGARRLGDALGDLEFEMLDSSGAWQALPAFREVGPLAREVELIPLPRGSSSRHVRLRLRQSRGNFKLDSLGLCRIRSRQVPQRVEVTDVLAWDEARGALLAEPTALTQLRNPEAHLVTYPGDAYALDFETPGCKDCEFFLDARGFYYEWARDVWFKDENPARLLELLLAPDRALVALAPEYRRLEPEIDRIFWESRVQINMRPPELR